MFRTRATSLLAAMALAAALAGLGAIAVQQARSAPETPTDLAQELTSVAIDDTPAATVNGHVITVGRVRAYESLAQQNQRLSSVAPPDKREILEGLIVEELLHQEAVRRGFEASEQEAADAMKEVRAASDPKQMEFVLAYTSRATGQSLDADAYWTLPQVASGYRRSLTVHRLVEEISAATPPERSEAGVTVETQRLRALASITISPEFR